MKSQKQGLSNKVSGSRDGSLVKNTCSCIGHGFYSRHLDGGSTIRNSGGPMPQAPDMCNVAKTYMKAKHVYTFFKVTTCWG